MRSSSSPVEIGREVVIYTDGACENNPGRGGWAALLTFGRHRKAISGGYRHTTNNRMELRAAIEGLKALQKPELRVRIVTDSRYVSEAVLQGWLEKWAGRGFRKGAGLRENADLWIELRIQLAQHVVEFEWVEGHAGHPENEECDGLAVAARQQPELAEDAGFTSPQTTNATLGLTLL